MFSQEDNKGPREFLKLLPVAFIIANIVGLYGIYVGLHCWPLIMQDDEARNHQKDKQEQPDTATVIMQFVIFNIVTLLLVICYARSIMTHPGTIPEAHEDPSWSYSAATSADLQWKEKKKSGDRRHCKWCTKYKPDRCHHCRVCQQCILKMDHHCPWIYNCVGFGNHKYFFLLLLYTTIDTHLITWTMLPSVMDCVDASTPFYRMFFLLFGETLAAFLGFLVTVFFSFHIYLMLKAMTTIEFCEKAIKRNAYDANLYDRGFIGNLLAVLGDNVFLWFLPLNPPSGNGIDYRLPQATEETPLTRELEHGRSIKSFDAPYRSYERQGRSSAGTGEAPEVEDRDTPGRHFPQYR